MSLVVYKNKDAISMLLFLAAEALVDEGLATEEQARRFVEKNLERTETETEQEECPSKT